jgi:hypothetical protein
MATKHSRATTAPRHNFNSPRKFSLVRASFSHSARRNPMHCSKTSGETASGRSFGHDRMTRAPREFWKNLQSRAVVKPNARAELATSHGCILLISREMNALFPCWR